MPFPTLCVPETVHLVHAELNPTLCGLRPSMNVHNHSASIKEERKTSKKEDDYRQVCVTDPLLVA